jgi:hypothetical protein
LRRDRASEVIALRQYFLFSRRFSDAFNSAKQSRDDSGRLRVRHREGHLEKALEEGRQGTRVRAQIFALSDDLEADERSEMDMLKESAEPRNPITGSADDCSRAMRGHAATAEP